MDDIFGKNDSGNLCSHRCRCFSYVDAAECVYAVLCGDLDVSASDSLLCDVGRTSVVICNGDAYLCVVDVDKRPCERYVVLSLSAYISRGVEGYDCLCIEFKGDICLVKLDCRNFVGSVFDNGDCNR